MTKDQGTSCANKPPPDEENIKDEVKVPDVEPEIFRGLLRFLYSGLAQENVTDNALDLLMAADKYGVDGLKQICEEKASIDRDNVVDALLVADSIQNEKIMSRAKAVFRSHVDELMTSVDETDRLPRALFLQLISLGRHPHLTAILCRFLILTL